MTLESKNVLVTGAGGFIGSHLAERLVTLGANVKAFVHYNAMNSYGWLNHSLVKDQMEIVLGDIRDRDCVEYAMKNIDVVFHLAALIGIPFSYIAPISYVKTNIEGTLNILQAVRDHDVQCLIHTSTSEVYGTAQYVPINEIHPLQGQSPYSASKIGADKLAESYHLSFGLPVVTVRPFNTFGPRQSERAVIPTIISQCLTGNVIRLGKLSPTRDLNYVSNTIDGFISAAISSQAIGQTINLGTGHEISIKDLTRLIARLMEKEITIVCEEQRVRPEKSEVERLVANTSKANNLMHWAPLINLEQGLVKTIQWVEENKAIYCPDIYVI